MKRSRHQVKVDFEPSLATLKFGTDPSSPVESSTSKPRTATTAAVHNRNVVGARAGRRAWRLEIDSQSENAEDNMAAVAGSVQEADDGPIDADPAVHEHKKMHLLGDSTTPLSEAEQLPTRSAEITPQSVMQDQDTAYVDTNLQVGSAETAILHHQRITDVLVFEYRKLVSAGRQSWFHIQKRLPSIRVRPDILEAYTSCRLLLGITIFVQLA